MIHWSIRLTCFLLLVMPLSMVVADDPKIISGPASAGLPARAQSWTSVQGRVSNPTSQAQELLVTSNFDGQAMLDFGQRLWIPPGSSRDFCYPMRAGDLKPVKLGTTGGGSLGLKGLLISQQKNQSERSLSRESQVMEFREEANFTSIIRNSDTAESVTDFAIALRQSILSNKRVGGLRLSNFPRIAQGLEGFDGLILATRQLDMDVAQRQALRDWLFHGGHLWVMLDECDPAQISALLGNDWSVSFIDQTLVNHGTLTSLSKAETKTESKKWDQPTPMARTLVWDFSVDVMLDGWPIALHRPVGQGFLMVTTMGGPVWFNARKEVIDGLFAVGSEFHRFSPRVPLQGEPVKQMLSQQMGRSIVSRTVVLFVLGTLVLAMTVLAVMLLMRKRLEWLAPMGAVLAVVCMGVMLVLSLSRRGEVPLTLASVQLQRVIPSQSAANIWGLINVYNPKGNAEAGAFSGRGGVLWPMENSKSSKLRRLIWSDVDQWQWENLQLPSGAVMQGEYQGVRLLDSSVRALVEFDAGNMKIHTQPTGWGALSDVVIGSDAGTIALNESASSQWTLTGQQLMEAAASAGGLMTDQSRQRQAVLAELAGKVRLFSATSLVGWSAEQQTQITLDATPRYQQSSLVVLPVNFVRPAANHAFVLPPAFLVCRSHRSKELGSAVLYNDKTRTWIGPNNAAQRFTLAFALPGELLPLKIDSGKMKISISAPTRRVEVTGQLAKGVSKPTGVDGPLREAVFDLPGDSLFVDANGEVIVGISVGESPDVSTQWKIEQVTLSLNVSVPQ